MKLTLALQVAGIEAALMHTEMILTHLPRAPLVVAAGFGIYVSHRRREFLRCGGALALSFLCFLMTCAIVSIPSYAQPAPPASLRPDLQEIVKLSQAQMGDDVILSYIKGSGKAYPLSAEEMIALKSQGISQKVIGALLDAKPAATAQPTLPAPAPAPAFNPAPAAPLQGGPAPGAMPAPAPGIVPTAGPSGAGGPPPGPPPADAPVSLDYFRTQLSPYGVWVEVPGYGPCWSPTRVIAATPGGDWRPYYDNGHWVYTDNGWFWVSDYAWGDIPFHYGRWIREPGYGWLWVPDLTWGPAWVCWREAEADGYLGWAPLPYGAVWVDGGWRYHGRAVVEVGFDFGLGEDFFVFVGRDHFHDHYFRYRSRLEYPFHVHREMVHGFYARTVLRNDFHRDEHGRLVNEGLGRAHIEHVTGRKVEVARFEERRPEVRTERQPPSRASGQVAANNSSSRASQPAAAEPNRVYRPPTAPSSKAAAPAKPIAPPRQNKK